MTAVRSLALLSLILLMAMPALAQDRVGFYGDLEASQRELVIPPLVFTEAYLMAHIPSYTEGIYGVEFGTNQWLPLPDSSEGNMSISWHGDTYYLSMPEIVLVAFADPALPDENGNLLLATIHFYPFQVGWPPEHYVIETIGAKWHGDSEPSPRIINFQGMAEYIDGDVFILNPSITSTSESTLSWIKSLY